MIHFFPSREIAVSLWGFGIHWYGLMYMVAFIIALYLTPRLQKYRSLDISKDTLTTIITWVIGGVIIGGRLGYVFFYEFSYFIQNPLDIFAVWNGGMSSHGGFIGVTLALLYILKKNRIPVIPFLDTIAVPVAIGLALGRLGNFINLELYGVVTSLPWGIEIPGVEGLRHPTQIYAIVKDLFIAFLCFSLLSNNRVKPGIVFSAFLILYTVLRSVIEIFRVQTHPEIDIFGLVLTRGQFLSMPILLAGFILLVYSRYQESS
ncbi:prolipoprotein diacylglyceryl transferase [Candidatus Peregrinibacteria bacterium CG10_big_fil_rev_8_21_14_0_10_42_8]|nr:MAG: prolipoprotein diacylglyceryl transferase [Candidatus Peregrinibacteria bacterium CG10_big_fil_rev_8_21_14_0_10_42_8]